MTKLDEIERALAAATEGPWEKRAWASVCVVQDIVQDRTSSIKQVANCFNLPADAELIALLRNTAADLVRVARAAESYMLYGLGEDNSDGESRLWEALAPLVGDGEEG